MAANAPFGQFDPTYEQPRRLELEPVDIDLTELRGRLLGTLVPPWRALNDSDRLGDSDAWFWTACEAGARSDQTGYVLLHELAGRLRVTNAVIDGPGASLSIGEQNALVERFRDEVVVPLRDDGVVTVHESGPEASLLDWVGKPAIDALARFSLLANRSTDGNHPRDSERWNEFLVEALPVNDGTGFAQVLQTVLVGNGWSESSAADLAVQVEQANDLLTLYRSVNG